MTTTVVEGRGPGPPTRPAPPLTLTNGKPVPIVHLCAEYWPYARTGGLAEAARGLAVCQAAEGLPTTVLLPLYRSVRETVPRLVPAGAPFEAQVGPRSEPARLWRSADPEPGPRVFFIENDGYFDRAGLYGQDGSDYPDNDRRFAFFCQAALSALPELTPVPLVLHAHDWHTALAPVYLRTIRAGHGYFNRIATVLSVHNAGFQGDFPYESIANTGLPGELFDWRRLEYYGRVNWLKGGLAYADMTVTVSPTHAHELRTKQGGFGLHDVFISLRDRLVGIANGVDFSLWNPATDTGIPSNYSVDDLTGKARCKAALQKAFGLRRLRRTPLFCMSARLVGQKGLDLILGGESLHWPEAQFIFLGEGEERYKTALAQIAAQYPDRVAVEFQFTNAVEHRLLAGADALLMPSLYEPCGLTQMRAQRYGTVPVARRVGGLADTIDDEVTGLLFDEYTPDDFDVALRRAIDHFRDRPAWQALMKEGMRRDFSWERSTSKYLAVYRRALQSTLGSQTKVVFTAS